MKVKIKEDAGRIFVRSFGKYYTFNPFLHMLMAVEGHVLEVETEYLFDNQFNCAPLKEGEGNGIKYPEHFSDYPRMYDGVYVSGLRIDAKYVEEIIGEDQRIGKMRCRWCGECSPVNDVCPKCERDDYLWKFVPTLDTSHNHIMDLVPVATEMPPK